MASTAIVLDMLMVMHDAEAFLADREARGLDRWDEVWDGVLHVAATPMIVHQEVAGGLERALYPIADALGLRALQLVSIFDEVRREQNFRIPDLVVFDLTLAEESSVVHGAQLVVEVLSPRDRSREKFPFFAMRRIPEVWLVEPRRRSIEVYVLRDDRYVRVQPDQHGVVHAPRLGLQLATIAGPRLRITAPDGTIVLV